MLFYLQFTNLFKGITKPASRRLARRGGIKRISGLIYDQTRGVLKVIRDAVTYTEHAKRKTVAAMNVRPPKVGTYPLRIRWLDDLYWSTANLLVWIFKLICLTRILNPFLVSDPRTLNLHDVWTWQGRQGEGQGQVPARGQDTPTPQVG